MAVELFAHAVQALELVTLIITGTFDDLCDGEGIMGGELREDAWAQVQHPLGAGDEVEIGHGLAGEHGIVIEPALLAPL